MKRTLLLSLVLFLLLPAFSLTETTEDPASVTYLDLGSGYMKLAKIEQILDAYPNLEKVDMFGTPVGPQSIAELTARYPGVEFGWTLIIGDHLVRTDVTAFSTLHGPNSQTHRAKELSLLRYCKQLKALDFGHNACEDISFLSELPELRLLIIAINRVTDITPLASLKKLEYLELFNNYVTDITPLTGLTHLMDLNLAYNKIEDLTPLYEMPWLKRLWLFRATDRNSLDLIPQAERDALTEHLPDTEIDFKSMPTAGTWRTHPHYFVLYDMFRSPEGYTPFEDSWPDE